MWVRASAATIVGLGITLFGTPVDAQISGRVIIEEGPIGVDVVFGPRPSVVVEYGARAPHVQRRSGAYQGRRPARWVRGMGLAQLEGYMAWIEAEYRYFRRLHPEDARHRFGWSRGELRRYVAWLKDERRFLRREHKRLTRHLRWDDDDWDDDDWDDDDWDDDDWDDDWDDDDRDDDWRSRGDRGAWKGARGARPRGGGHGRRGGGRGQGG